MHDLKCDRCEAGKSVLSELREKLYELVEEAENEFSGGESTPLYRQHTSTLRRYYEAEEKIIDLKRHQLRTAWSDHQRQLIIEHLTESSAMITLDWAQKVLPLKARETQKVVSSNKKWVYKTFLFSGLFWKERVFCSCGSCVGKSRWSSSPAHFHPSL